MLSVVIVAGVVATLVIAAVATKNATGFNPDPQAWFLTLAVPVFLLLGVTAYYSDEKPY
jgi:hypothetical protein